MSKIDKNSMSMLVLEELLATNALIPYIYLQCTSKMDLYLISFSKMSHYVEIHHKYFRCCATESRLNTENDTHDVCLFDCNLHR